MAQVVSNNTGTTLSVSCSSSDTELTVTDGSAFPALSSGDWCLATLPLIGAGGEEIAWEIVKIVSRSGNTLTVERGQEGTSPRSWSAGARIEVRPTAGSHQVRTEYLDEVGEALESTDLVTGYDASADASRAFLLSRLRAYIEAALAPVAVSGDYNELINVPAADPDILFAGDIETLEKLNGLLTDATLIDGDTLATVATSGEYSDLTGRPTLGTAAGSDAGDFEPSGAVSVHEVAYSHGRIPSADQKAALDGANAPAAGNVYATMADIGAAGGGSVTSVAITGANGITVSGSPITTSGTIAIDVDAVGLQSFLGLGSAAYTSSTDYATAAQGSSIPTALADLDTTVTGSELNADHAKLVGIEENSTADQLAADVPVAATPENYSADTADVEAHLAGIDTALGSVGTGGGSGDLSTSDIDTLAKINAIVSDATLIDGDTLAAVATTGDYDDLIGKPTITGDYAITYSGINGIEIDATLTSGTDATVQIGLAATVSKTDAEETFTGHKTLTGYTETGATLAVDDDGDGTYSVTIPFDGRRYSCTVTQDVDVIYDLPADSSVRGSAIVDFIQDAIGNRVVALPAGSEFSSSTLEEVDSTANARTRAIFTQFSATGVDVDMDERGVPA